VDAAGEVTHVGDGGLRCARYRAGRRHRAGRGQGKVQVLSAHYLTMIF